VQWTTPKIAPSPWEIEGPYLVLGSLGPPESAPPNGISIGSAVFAGITNVTNRQAETQTDRLTTLMLRCGLIIIIIKIIIIIGRNEIGR